MTTTATTARDRASAALANLANLASDARSRASDARDRNMPDTAYVLDDIASTLHRARRRLDEDGDNYLDAAWAFVDGGRTVLASIGPDGVTANTARTYRKANHG